MWLIFFINQVNQQPSHTQADILQIEMRQHLLLNLHRAAQQDDNLTIMTLYIPKHLQRGARSPCTRSCRTNKATDRAHTPTIHPRKRKTLTVRIGASPPREGWMDGAKEERGMRRKEEKWERVYIQGEPWRGGHHLQHRGGETARMRRLDSTPASARPHAAP